MWNSGLRVIISALRLESVRVRLGLGVGLVGWS